MIFILHTSDGNKIKINDADLEKIENNTDAFMIKLNQGYVRPSFITCILPTGESEMKIKQTLQRHNDHVKVIGQEKVNAVENLMDKREDPKVEDAKQLAGQDSKKFQPIK